MQYKNSYAQDSETSGVQRPQKPVEGTPIPQAIIFTQDQDQGGVTSMSVSA